MGRIKDLPLKDAVDSDDSLIVDGENGTKRVNVSAFIPKEGFETDASGEYSHAEGYKTTASGSNSHVEGYQSQALTDSSHAEGYNCITEVDDYIQSIGLGLGLHAEGYGTKASNCAAHAEGQGTIASGECSHAEGYKTTAYNNSTHSEGYETTASGRYSHAEGKSTTASGATSHAEGHGTIASSEDSHAEGYETEASAFHSHAEGTRTKASNSAAHAEGNNTEASGKYSHAEGYYTTVSGDFSHVEGWYSEATGEVSHSEGWKSIASGYNTHAEGYNTTAFGAHSHAEGYMTKSNGESSHAEGYGTEARGPYSHAEGWGTVAGQYCHVHGIGNEIDESGIKYATVVGGGLLDDEDGNGEPELTRKNIHTLDWNGNAEFAGDVTAFMKDQDRRISLSEAYNSAESRRVIKLDSDLFTTTRPLSFKKKDLYMHDNLVFGQFIVHMEMLGESIDINGLPPSVNQYPVTYSQIRGTSTYVSMNPSGTSIELDGGILDFDGSDILITFMYVRDTETDYPALNNRNNWYYPG